MTGSRYDGRTQKEVQKELAQKALDADESQKSTNRNLSLFQTYMNRSPPPPTLISHKVLIKWFL